MIWTGLWGILMLAGLGYLAAYLLRRPRSLSHPVLSSLHYGMLTGFAMATCGLVLILTSPDGGDDTTLLVLGLLVPIGIGTTAGWILYRLLQMRARQG